MNRIQRLEERIERLERKEGNSEIILPGSFYDYIYGHAKPVPVSEAVELILEHLGLEVKKERATPEKTVLVKTKKDKK